MRGAQNSSASYGLWIMGTTREQPRIEGQLGASKGGSEDGEGVESVETGGEKQGNINRFRRQRNARRGALPGKARGEKKS